MHRIVLDSSASLLYEVHTEAPSFKGAWYRPSSLHLSVECGRLTLLTTIELSYWTLLSETLCMPIRQFVLYRKEFHPIKNLVFLKQGTVDSGGCLITD